MDFYVRMKQDLWLRYLVIGDKMQKYGQISWVISSNQSGYVQRSSAFQILHLHISDSALSHIREWCVFFHAEVRHLHHSFSISQSLISLHISRSLLFFTLCCFPFFRKPQHAHAPCLPRSGACLLGNMETLNPYLNSWECGTRLGWWLRPHSVLEAFIAKHTLYTQSVYDFCLWIGLFRPDCKLLQSQRLLSASEIIVYALTAPHSYITCQRLVWMAEHNQ